MFYDVFTSLCEKKGVSPNKALTDCGISRTSTAKWREGAIPRGITLQKLADYFGVTTDYLLTGEETKKPATENGDELDETLERLRTRPECRMLFKLADGATAEDVKKAVAVIEALRSTEGQ